MTYPARNISATLSSRASASAALGHGAMLRVSHRSLTTFCKPARPSRNARIFASLRAIRFGFPPSCEATIAATIRAADSSEIVRSGRRLGQGGNSLLRDLIPLSGEFTGARRRNSCNRIFTYSVAVHGKKAAPLQDRPLCFVSVVGRTPSQGGGNIIRLAGGFAFAARRSPKPFVTRDYHSALEAKVNHVAHLSFLKSAEPVRPVSVTHQ